MTTAYTAEKQCARCGEVKPLGDFTRDRKRADGHGRWCKPCMAAYVRALRAANPEKAREDESRYREANRDRIRRAARRWREANPEKARESTRNWVRSERGRQAQRQYEMARPEGHRETLVQKRTRDRITVFDHYGRVCICCSATTALQIDHVTAFDRSDGQPRSGAALYHWLVKNSFPEGFQTLCRPCNRSKSDGEHCVLTH